MHHWRRATRYFDQEQQRHCRCYLQVDFAFSFLTDCADQPPVRGLQLCVNLVDSRALSWHSRRLPTDITSSIHPSFPFQRKLSQHSIMSAIIMESRLHLVEVSQRARNRETTGRSGH